MNLLEDTVLPEYHPFEYFTGGLPPGPFLDNSLGGIRDLVEASEKRDDFLCTARELSLIGLVAYFEAFWKNLFSSVVNIHPQPLLHLRKGRGDIRIEVADLLALGPSVWARLGFLVAEKLDFGSATMVNSLFKSLVGCEPFSEEESRDYDQLLKDRNLLVHHGGVFTSRYHSSRVIQREYKDDVFYNSLLVTKDEMREWLAFVKRVANRALGTVPDAVRAMLLDKGVVLTPARLKALDVLGWEVDTP